MATAILVFIGFVAVLAMLYGGLLIFAAANVPTGGDKEASAGEMWALGGLASLVTVICIAIWRAFS